MREILFRGKRTDATVPPWVYGGIAAIAGPDADYRERAFMIEGGASQGYIGFSWEVWRETVGQFTGRTDKNGQKVFEGDILSLFGGKDRGVVLWSDHDQCYFISPSGDEHFTLGDFGDFGKPEYYEVIGNIHDNPELLNGGGADE